MSKIHVIDGHGPTIEQAIGIGLVGLVGVLVLVLMTVSSGNAPWQAEKEACYFVTDRNGVEHASVEPTDLIGVEGAGPVVVFNTEKEWGFVYDPASTRANKDCLRERGVEVPPVQESSNGE